jgi:hypothetical protein
VYIIELTTKGGRSWSALGEVRTSNGWRQNLLKSTGAIMKIIHRAIALIFLCVSINVNAADLTIPNGGRVSVELINAYAAFDNTLSINSPGNIAIAFTGCQLQPSVGLGGLWVISEENSQRGCRVDLDADSTTPGIQNFEAGTTFEFGMCAQTDSDANCEYVWSSNAASNSDGDDHLLTTNFATNAWRLNWEDLEDLGDFDFDDLIVVFRVQQDTDGDGLWDDWETTGIDTNGDGAPEIVLANADPLRKDIYVEVDCLVDDGNGNGSLADLEDHSHCMTLAALTDVVTAFANAPLPNPDGTTGVQLHVDVGTTLGAGVSTFNISGVTGYIGDLGGGNTINETGNEIIDWDGAAGDPATSMYDLKEANFDDDRRFAYRYGMMAHQVNARNPVNDCTSGWGENNRGGNDFIVSLGGLRDLDGNGTGDTGCWWSTTANNTDDDGDGAIDEDPRDGRDNDGDCVAGTDTDGDGNPCDFGDIGVDEDGGHSTGNRVQLAGTFMHEFGHNLGLSHGGGDRTNNKPNYLSVMNYRSGWQFCGVPTSAAAAGAFPGACTFSLVVLPPTAAGTLVETSLDECAGIDNNSGWFGAMDWNGGGLSGVLNCNPPNNSNVRSDIDGDGSSNDTLAGFDDWNNIVWNFQNSPTYVNGVADTEDDELTPEIYEEILRSMTERFAPAITFELDGPATALPGDTVTMTATIANTGKGPATQTVATLTDPFGTEDSFDLDVLAVSEENTRDQDFSIAANACPETLTANADLIYRDFADVIYEMDTSADVEVLDVTPPELTVSLSKESMWPPNHTMHDISAAIVVTDECDPDPQIKLISVTSNEPDNGLGDGNTEQDVQNALVGSDDRSFSLRAERQGGKSGKGSKGERIYTIIYEAADSSGNTTQQTVIVTVQK